MRIVIVSGGTGGHIYPGIAIAQEIKRRSPSASILFLGSKEGLEKELVPREGFEIKLVWARALLRQLSYQAVSAPFVSLIGFFQSLKILKEFSPDILVSTGGYASLPVVFAAKARGIPILLLEQNVLPGAVNRLSRRFAKKCFLSWPQSEQYIKGVVVGNPVRRAIIEAKQRSSRGPDNKKVVLVVGGSQGSQKINEAVVSALPELPAEVQVLHIIGNRDSGWVSRYLEGKKVKNYQALPYLHDMSQALASADLVVSRAGATAIAEFLVCGLPMVLVPFPYAAEDHQRLNAKAVADSGAAIVVEDKDFSSQKFIELINDSSLNYDKMSKASAALARPEAAERIVRYIYA